MTQYQLTRDSDILQRLFTGDGQVGRLVESEQGLFLFPTKGLERV